MNKKLISGIFALGIAASMASLAASAVKLGNVNQDNKIDIEDAVAVISHVNGVKALTPDEEKIADVDKSNKVDIEDAVKIIAHINGVSALPDEDVVTSSPDSQADSSSTESKPDISTPDSSSTESKPDISEPDSEQVHIRIDGIEELTLKKGETIPQKYGKFPDPDDMSTWDLESFYMDLREGMYIGNDGRERSSELTNIKEVNTGKELQDYIVEEIPITEDIDFEKIWSEKLHGEPQLEDGEYLITIYNDSPYKGDDFSFKATCGDDTLMLANRQPFTDETNTNVRVRGSFSFIVKNKEATYDKPTSMLILSNLPVDREGNVYSLYVSPASQADENHHVEIHWEYPKNYKDGERTIDLFNQMADGNYYLNFNGDSTILGKDSKFYVYIQQIDKKDSRASITLPGRNIDTNLVIKDGTKYKIVNENQKQYTRNISTVENMMDFNKIFSSIAKNSDAMEFIDQTEDEEGNVTERYRAKVSYPVVEDVNIEATYANFSGSVANGNLKKLVMYTDDYNDENLQTTLYLETGMIMFKPYYQAPKGTIPDFSTWEKIG